MNCYICNQIITLLLMNNCHHCGATLPSNAIYCPSCGYKVTSETCCPQCQSPIRPTDRFCMKCGTLLTSQPPVISQPPKLTFDNHVLDDPFKDNSFGHPLGTTTCPTCHSIIPDTNRICPECGCMLSQSRKNKPLQTDFPEGTPPVYSHNGRKTVTVIVIIGILLFFLLAWALIQKHLTNASLSPDHEMQVPSEEVIDENNIPEPYLPSATEEEDSNKEEDFDN